MDGFLLAYKEKGVSSNHLVQAVKMSLSLKKVGHLGTLDPMAEGLLVLAINRATRFSSFFLESDKSYQAKVQFGSKTDTDDALGNIIESSDIIPQEKDINSQLELFIGKSLQNPPFFSALKHKGKPLYKYARDGEYISKPPREINIFSIKNIEYGNSRCNFLIHCSKGTYIRSIARDLGDELGCCAHLSGLTRVTQGIFNIKNSNIADEIKIDDLISIENAFQSFNRIDLDESSTKIFINGGKVNINAYANDYYRIYDNSSKFLGLGFLQESLLALKRLV